ncbi:hypothetical protein GL325_15165 [Aeromicrobium sp. 636]|uniref:PT domain-containing protein n=2 Tax=Aeromicrobium senzhongii TaxID=2663859 RepID=A0A8I0EY42_9ACTN|nr:PT domain-containing protein [Aeromicrobium senzhongii]MCQ3999763.1 hypothetical protein [Aeromicrobium sp. 636]MTB89682.1 hypothetical protein [Aeromicrobium senzhongii]QNL96033.1 PT domain-containing protein [Aeromicrobium senzhongii]
MPEKLRASTVDLLGGVAAEGASTDSSITLTTGGQTSTVAIPRLAAPRTDIPQTTNAPWLIPASGEVPAITTPASAVGTVELGMPQGFTVKATIHPAAGETIPSDLTCTGPADLDLGSIPVNGDPVTSPTSEPTSQPTSEPTSEPTSQPTSEPTSQPTSEPTGQPTSEPTTEPTDGAGSEAPELISSDVVSPGDVLTFSFGQNWVGREVAFELHSDPIAMGTRTVDVSGHASVRVPENAPLGEHTVELANNGRVIAAIPIEIVAADAGGDDDWSNDDAYDDSDWLASTGGPSAGLAALGGVLVLAGAGVVLMRRRARRD